MKGAWHGRKGGGEAGDRMEAKPDKLYLLLTGLRCSLRGHAAMAAPRDVWRKWTRKRGASGPPRGPLTRGLTSAHRNLPGRLVYIVTAPGQALLNYFNNYHREYWPAKAPSGG